MSASLATAVVAPAGAAVVDPFTATQSSASSGAVSGSFMGGFFSERFASSANFSSTRTASLAINAGTATSTFTGTLNLNAPRSTYLDYQTTGLAIGDLSNLSTVSLSISFTSFVGQYQLSFDEAFVAGGTKAFNVASSFTGTVNLSLSKSDFMKYDGTGPFTGWNRINLFNITFDAYQAGSAVVSNLNYTLVPAPGALALLGVAGVVGSRRRR